MKHHIGLFIAVLVLMGTVATSLAQTSTALPYPPQYGKPFKYVPDRRDVTMYQVNMRSFSAKGDFKAVIDRLDSIKALGVNVIYLMPVFPVGVLKSVNSPYATKDYDEVGSEFGTLEDLRTLVDKAHKLKIAVLMDIVANHTSWDHPWIANKNWYLQDSAGNIKYPRNWRDVAQLNFNNDDLRLALIKSMKSWVYKANIDGFRCDYADGPPVDFWKQAIDTLKNISTHKLLLLAEGSRPEHFEVGFDYNFGFSFFGNLKSIYKNNRSVRSIDTVNLRDYKGTISEGQGMVRYLTNHDVNSSDGTPLDLFGGKKGSMAAFVVVAYMKGVPMIYNGQEIGTPFRLVFPFKSTPVNWTLDNPDVTAEYKKIIAFRNKSKAIRRGRLNSYSSDDVCVFTKEIGSEKVLVISNLRDKSVTYNIPSAFVNTTWKDVFTGTKTTLNTEIKLEPYQYLVFKK
ncbi:MAG: amyB 2 [Segetibacter sp.]|nr:amyB 2 [Segetibacter sp.]